MKHPALYIAFSLAAGILGGPLVATHLPHVLPAFLAAATIFLLAAFLLLRKHRDASAFALSLLAWLLLGAAAAIAEPLAVPANQVTRVIAFGQLDASEPLRWRGVLRADPLRLPWGLRYIIDLQEAQSGGQWMEVAGGLRANYYFDEGSKEDAAAVRAGDGVEVLMRAEPVRNFGDPGAFDYRTYLARQQIQVTGTLRNATLLTPISGARPGVVQVIAYGLARMRGGLIREVDALLADDPGRAAVARAMLLGDRSFLDSEQIEAFQQTGSYHVLVIAGLHVGMLAFALLWLCRRLRLPLLASTLVTIAGLAAYVAIVEDRPPILRAALMATVYLLARLMFRRTYLLNVIGLAALLILVFRPSELRDASFLLSFLAALSIGGISAPLIGSTTEKYVRSLGHLGDPTRDPVQNPHVAQFRLDLRSASNWLASCLPGFLSRYANSAVVVPCRVVLLLTEMVIVSAVLQVGLLPLTAQYFHRLSVVAPAANVPAVLLTGIVVPYGLLTLSAGIFWPWLGRVLGYGFSTLLGLLIGTAHYFARPGWSSFRLPAPPTYVMVPFFIAGLLFSIGLSARIRWVAWTAFVALMLFSGLIAVYPFAPRLQAGRLEITVLDVGQGDSIFVAFPDGKTMLVDGGGLPGGDYNQGARSGIDVGEEVVSSYLWTRGIKRLDAVVLTHGHEDHLGGLPAVLRNFKVGELWIGRDVESRAFHELLGTANDRGVPIVHKMRGQSYDWGGVAVRVLWPPDDDDVRAATNDDSIVLRLEDGSEAALLSGDIERPVESSLVGDKDELTSVFLKVPHHGSKTSSTEPFLDAVHPQFAAISAGFNNTFGHPNAEVLDRIAAQGARMFRTDRDGAITALLDGHGLAVRAFLDGN